MSWNWERRERARPGVAGGTATGAADGAEEVVPGGREAGDVS